MTRALRATLAAVALLAAGACGDRDAAPPEGRPIVVVSVDTLRSDRLPAYGYEGVETPAVDALRADSVLFERAYSPSPLTLPAHASLFTGLLPPEHGVRDNAGYRLEEGAGPTMPQLLRDAGYATGGAVSAFVLRAETGVGRGFDWFEDRIEGGERTTLGDLQRPGGATLDAALDWLDTVREKPFFLFFHIYEPHVPRDPPEPFASRYPDPYDGEVAASDAIVGRLLEALRDRGLYEGSTVVLLSDHGEGLGDHGEDEHGILLYRESLQVPLLLKMPGNRGAGATVAAPVHLPDVAPTLLALAGAEVPPGLPGVSLVGPAVGSGEPDGLTERPLYAETFHPRLRYGWSELLSVIRGRHHYIEGPDRELYDLVADPAERDDLVREDRRTYATLRDALDAYDAELEPPFEEPGETRDALAALGYLGSTADAEGPLPDPKTKVGALETLREGIARLQDQRPEEALPLLRRSVEEIPGSVDAWQFLGLALQQTGRPREAYRALQEAFELSNGAPHLAEPLADLAFRLRSWDDAAAFLALAAERRPDRLQLHLLRARALLFGGRLDEAERAAARAVELAPESAEAHYELGAVRMGRRELPAAEEALRRSLELAPDHVPALGDLAILLMTQGRRDEARPLLERLLEVDPDNESARRALARLNG